MTIYWVRHGQTDSNRERVVQTPDTPLSSLGQQQAKLLANAYKEADIRQILCSDYTRTQQTAAPLLTAINCTVEYSELLRERNFGALRGKPYDSIKDDFFAPDYQPPQGENHSQFLQRVSQAWDWTLQQAKQTAGDTLVMTHGLVLRAILSEKLFVHARQLDELMFENTCVTSISDSGRLTGELLCDVTHLSSHPTSVETHQGAV